MSDEVVNHPQSWSVIPLGEFVDSEKGKKPKSQKKFSDKEYLYPYVDIEAFEKGNIKSWTNGEGCRLCSKDDFLMVWDGSRSGLVGKGMSGALGSTLVRINFPEIENDYAYYFLQSKYLEINTRAKGSGTPHVDPDLLWNYQFPIAPVQEQKRIVTKIEELFSELDDGTESLKTARVQLEMYRQAVLKSAFEGKLVSTESKWQETSLGKLTNLVTSGSRGWAKYYSDSGDLFIRAQNLKYDRLDLTEKAYVEIPNKTEGTRTQLQINDLLITITGANVTKSALIKKDIGTAYVSQHVALCRPTEAVLPKFLYWFVVAEAAGRKQLNKAAYGAGKPGLNLNNIKSVQLSIPSYEEQVSVVEIIEEKLTLCGQFEQDIERAISTCIFLRQSILKKAFSGQLVEQDPADEPANALLERIKAEKEKINKTQQKRRAVA